MNKLCERFVKLHLRTIAMESPTDRTPLLSSEEVQEISVNTNQSHHQVSDSEHLDDISCPPDNDTLNNKVADDLSKIPERLQDSSIVNHLLEHVDVVPRHCNSNASRLEDVTGIYEVVPGIPKGHQRTLRMLCISALVFCTTCAGILHISVVKLYIYQVITEQVYGNISQHVQVNVQPCINDTNQSTGLVLRNEVQDGSADLEMKLEVLSAVLALVSNIFLGTYSDVLGRKVIMLLPIIGHLLRSISLPVVITCKLGLNFLYVGYIIDGICGGHTGISLGYYLYTTDITDNEKDRTQCMVAVSVSAAFGVTLLGIVFGLFIQDTGFLYPSITACIFLVLNVFVICFCLPETVRRTRGKVFVSPLSMLKTTSETLLARDRPEKRKIILLGLLAIFFMEVIADGAGDVDSLFLIRQPFCWGSFKRSVFVAAAGGASLIVTIFLTKVLLNCVDGSVLAAFGCLSSVGGKIMFAFASSDMDVFLGAAIGLAGGAVSPILRSILSCAVASDRQGSLFAGIGMISSLCVCLSQVIALSTYKATLSLLPGTIYLVIAGCYILAFVIFVYFIFLLRKKFTLPRTDSQLNIQGDDSECSD